MIVETLIEFATGTSLLRETDRPSDLPIVRNGPPGTFVLFPGGLRISLPTDQIVFAEEAGGRVRVGFGGMRFAGTEVDAGTEAERLIFHRVRELHPEDELSPARSHTMRLDADLVSSILEDGQLVW